MKVCEFKKYMQYGLGRCYAVLSACEHKETYRSAVLYGCLHSLAYDEQCEGTRAEYIYELSLLFGDGEYFLSRIIQKFEKVTAAHGSFDHLCDLLCAFAKGGNNKAKSALESKYNSLYAVLIKPRKIKNYDYARDGFERISSRLVSFGGLPVFLKIAADLGNLFLKNEDYCGWDFEYFYIDFCDLYGKAEAEEVLRQKSLNSPAISKFFEAMQKEEQDRLHITEPRYEKAAPTAEEIIKLVDAGKATPADTLNFGRYASSEQKNILAEAIMRESDKDKQAELLQAFRLCGFPLGVDGLAELFEHSNQNLRFAVTDVLEETKDVQAHDMAVDFIEMDGNYLAGIRMLILNYTEADRGLLTDTLRNLNVKKADKDGLHSLFMKIIGGFKEGVNLPKETLYFIYENSFCSCCREKAVKYMARHGWLTEEIIAECAHDSNEDIRKFAGK